MKKMNRLLKYVLSVPLLLGATQVSAIPVDIELALVIDISGSVDATDYSLQMNGYKAAFNNTVVQNNIASLTNGIAIEVLFFSDSSYVGGIESLLTSATDASAFANTIGALSRPGSGGTNIAAGMNAGINWLATNGYEGTKLVMDVSGDGDSSAYDTQAARDAAALAGIMVNGLAIDDRTYFNGGCLAGGFYTDNVITPGGMCFQATGFDTFETAVIAKIQAETQNPVPEPATMLLMGIGLLGLGAKRRKS